MRRFLPRFYVEGYVDPDSPAGEPPVVWVHRPAVGVFQPAPVEPAAGARHFNAVEEPALQGKEGLEPLLDAVEEEARRAIREKLPARETLAPGERDALASLFALLGMRLSARVGDLDETEIRRGYDQILPALREMGWVFWEVEPPDYFVSSNSPFHVAFPKGDAFVQGMELHAPDVEVTLPLGPRLALHATWKRRGELFRRAGEGVLLELNARTLLRATRFVLAPKPAIPG